MKIHLVKGAVSKYYVEFYMEIVSLLPIYFFETFTLVCSCLVIFFILGFNSKLHCLFIYLFSIYLFL